MRKKQGVPRRNTIQEKPTKHFKYFPAGFFKTKYLYTVTWKTFYDDLARLDTKDFLALYSYSSMKCLYIHFARSDHGLEPFSLSEFKSLPRDQLQKIFGEKFNALIRFNQRFSVDYKLSTIHHFVFNSTWHRAALNLGFWGKQSLLSFLTRTKYVECVDFQSLKESLETLQKTPPYKARQELGDLYDGPVGINRHFKKYNCSLRELRYLLITEKDRTFIIASLGESCRARVNANLRKISLHLNLESLKEKPFSFWNGEIPRDCWGVKIFMLLEQSRNLYFSSNFFRQCYDKTLEEYAGYTRAQFDKFSATRNPGPLWRPF